MIEYRLIDGGYEIYVNGAKVIHQPHSPTRGLDVTLAEGEAERLAKLVCKKLELGTSAVVESSEEAELMAETSDARIQEMAETSLSEYKKMAQESQNTIVSLKKEIQDLKGLMEQFLGEKSQIELQ